jgi:hypothetical protein
VNYDTASSSNPLSLVLAAEAVLGLRLELFQSLFTCFITSAFLFLLKIYKSLNFKTLSNSAFH